MRRSSRWSMSGMRAACIIRRRPWAARSSARAATSTTSKVYFLAGREAGTIEGPNGVRFRRRGKRIRMQVRNIAGGAARCLRRPGKRQRHPRFRPEQPSRRLHRSPSLKFDADQSVPPASYYIGSTVSEQLPPHSRCWCAELAGGVPNMRSHGVEKCSFKPS